MINPENYTIETKVEFNNGQAGGTSGSQPRFEKKPPGELAFEFLYDNTGIIDGNPRDDIADDLAKLNDFLMGYDGDIHQTRFFKFVWGTSLMKGVCSSLSIAYKLFNPDGKPIRAICKVTIRELVSIPLFKERSGYLVRTGNLCSKRFSPPSLKDSVSYSTLSPVTL